MVPITKLQIIQASSIFCLAKSKLDKFKILSIRNVGAVRHTHSKKPAQVLDLETKAAARGGAQAGRLDDDTARQEKQLKLRRHQRERERERQSVDQAKIKIKTSRQKINTTTHRQRARARTRERERLGETQSRLDSN